MENQLETKTEHDVETGIINIGGIVCWIGNGLVVFANGGGPRAQQKTSTPVCLVIGTPQKGA